MSSEDARYNNFLHLNQELSKLSGTPKSLLIQKQISDGQSQHFNE